jgi:5-formyltetrahydrofolate cyclo-ligase
LARRAGLIGETTPVVTTVHALQVVEGPIRMARHDVALDYIATPQEVIANGQRYGPPAGIYWDELPPEKLDAIPVLRQQGQAKETVSTESSWPHNVRQGEGGE